MIEIVSGAPAGASFGRNEKTKKTFEMVEIRHDQPLLERESTPGIHETLGAVCKAIGHDLVARLQADFVLDGNALPYPHFVQCGFFVIDHLDIVWLTLDGQAWVINHYMHQAGILPQ